MNFQQTNQHKIETCEKCHKQAGSRTFTFGDYFLCNKCYDLKGSRRCKNETLCHKCLKPMDSAPMLNGELPEHYGCTDKVSMVTYNHNIREVKFLTTPNFVFGYSQVISTLTAYEHACQQFGIFKSCNKMSNRVPSIKRKIDDTVNELSDLITVPVEQCFVCDHKECETSDYNKVYCSRHVMFADVKNTEIGKNF